MKTLKKELFSGFVMQTAEMKHVKGGRKLLDKVATRNPVTGGSMCAYDDGCNWYDTLNYYDNDTFEVVIHQ